jgi:hypothetical protein
MLVYIGIKAAIRQSFVGQVVVVEFDNFDAQRVAAYDDAKVNALLADERIIRNKLKIRSVISNARAFMAVQDEFGSFSKYIWDFTGGKPIDLFKLAARASIRLMVRGVGILEVTERVTLEESKLSSMAAATSHSSVARRWRSPDCPCRTFS